MHFFGLWVGNVHSEVVDQDELRASFERFGGIIYIHYVCIIYISIDI